MIINGTDIRTLGFVPAVDGRKLPGIGMSHKVEPSSGRVAGVFTGHSWGPGTISQSGLVVGEDAADAWVKLRSIIRLCRPGSKIESTLAFPDLPGQEWLGLLDENTDRGNQAGRTTPVLKLDLVWALRDKRARELVDTVVETASGVAEEIDLGDAPTEAVITLLAPGDDVLVEVLDADDQVIRTLSWSNDGTAGTLVIDAAGGTIVQGGVNAIGGMADAWEFPVLDPDEGAAQIRVTGGAATVRYRKRSWT